MRKGGELGWGVCRWDGMRIYIWGPGGWFVGEVDVVADGAAEAAAGDGGGRRHDG